MRLHLEANKRTQKEKGPEETLISLSGHSYLLLRKLTAADPVYERPEYEHRANEACERCLRTNALAKLPLQLCRDCKEGCSKCKNCVELWEYGKDKGVTEYILSV